MSWETVIGLEIHVQLSTKSKLFSGGSTEFGAESNTHVDLIDMGLPGVLPVANKEAFYKAIRFGQIVWLYKMLLCLQLGELPAIPYLSSQHVY